MKTKSLLLLIIFFLFSITSYSQCAFTIQMQDSFGDGWNGGSISVTQGGSTVGTATISSGSSGSATINASGTGLVSFVWTTGSWGAEVSFTITNTSGQVIYTTNGAPSSGTFLTYSCQPCQDFTFTINGLAQNDTSFIDMCLTSPITATGSYPNNGQNYQQSDANVTWSWDINHEGNHITQDGVGLNVFTPTFTEGGGYLVNVTATDENGCVYTHTAVRLRVALEPIWAGSAPDTVCPGEVFTLSMSQYDTVTGINNTDMTYNVDPWEYTEPEVLFQTSCFYDDQTGVAQTAEFTYTSYNPSCVITSVNDIQSIVIYIEHSYIGDLSLYVTCPNGSQLDLVTFGSGSSCGSAYFGSPIDDYCGLCGNDCALDPVTGIPINGGTVLPYTWTPNGTMTLPQACNGIYSATVPNTTTYLPLNGFNSLIGCPLNGTWSVSIVDYLGADDGYVNQFEIHFDPTLTQNCAQGTTWEINPTYHGEVWSGSNIISGTGGTVQASSNVSGSIPYTFTVTDDFNCSHDTTVYVYVRNQSDSLCCIFPEPNAGNDTTVCGNLFSFSPIISNGTSFQWTVGTKPEGAANPNIINPNSPNASVNIGINYGTYSFIFEETHNAESCSAIDSIIVTFLPMPASTFNSTPIACYGDETTITYTGNMIGVENAVYNWNFGDGMATNITGNLHGPFNVIWGNTGIHTVTLSVSIGSCISPQTNVNILTPTPLDLSIATTNITCYGLNNGIANATVTGGTPPYQYSWDSGTAIQQNIEPGNYILTVTDANGCTQTQSYIITEPPELIITDTTYSHLQCYNSYDGSIGINVIGGTNPLSYNWNDGHQGEINRVSLAAGNYTITIADAHGCSLTEAFQITQPDELVAIISQNIIICEGQEAIIQAQGVGGIPEYRYYWDVTPTNNTYSEETASIIETPLVSTVYRCRIEDAHHCISNEVIMQVTVSPDIVINTILLQNNTCYNSCDGKATMQIDGGIPPLEYSWASPSNSMHNICAGLYSVTINDAAGCFETTSFIIEEPTALTFSTHSEPVNCFGSNDGFAEIAVSGGTSPYLYLWPDGQTTPSIITGVGNYEVTVTDFNNCRITTIIDVDGPAEMLTLNMDNRTICLNQSSTLITETTGGTQFYDYHWSDGNGNEYFDNAWIVNPIENTTYTLTVTDANGCTSSPEPVTVSVYQPVIINSIYSDNELICPGQSATIRANISGGDGGPYLMRYSLNRDGTEDTIVGSPFTIYPEVTSWIYVFVEDMCANAPAVDSIRITVHPNPNRGFTADVINGCAPLTITFNDENIESFDTYTWRFGDDFYSSERFVSHTYTEPGTYSVELEIRDNIGCDYLYRAENFITIYPNPYSMFSMSNESINPEETLIEFQNLSENATNYYWSFGDGDSSVNVNPYHYFNINSLEYTTCLIAENTYNCKDTSCRTIAVEGLMLIYFPTSFTPNEDGRNDCFRPCGYGINSNDYSLKIIDRYGELIFKTDTFIATEENGNCSECNDGSWNGKRNNIGDYLPVESYVWQCTFKDKFGNQYTKEGYVTLIR